MTNEFINNLHAPINERFVWIKAQAIDVNHNVDFIMVLLTNKLGLYGEDGGSNAYVKLERKMVDLEEPKVESKK